MLKRIICIIISFFISFTAIAEQVRLTSLVILDVNDEVSSTQVRYGAGVAFKVQTPQYFLQGIEIEIKQSNTTLYFQNSLEYQIFACQQPLSQDNLIFSATSLEKKLLPNRLSTNVQIPTREKHSLKTSTYTTVIPTVLTEDTCLLVRILPVLKGLSTEFEQALFTISARPIFTNEGGLRIHTQFPKQHAPVYMSLNEVPISLPEDNDFLIVPIGEYKLILEADEYRTEVRNIKIQQANILDVHILFRSIIPLLYVYVPKEVEVFLDRKKIAQEKTPMEISVGKHTIRLQLGHYELIRQIDAEEGKTYTISMDIDVDLMVED
ncbi:MAG: hypothetical protein IJU92_03585 [Spirochaetaceae bacterium]|nr:hypothetical protein [Spirochaetaceae bacterium]